ncbi:hypothetical protein [Absiella sp. AM29-15]|uniref:hypothetical protein n=1 Tax=Absiella sp. AM29-15 TaxID=2292278 RepID=UPI000E40A8A2|nr:hypothetical protein [Absiella sp. AM29-15]RGC52264.1 hypothetical protein DW761_06760 [Absiella sp. AM29-15]
MKKAGYVAFILISLIMFLCCMWLSGTQVKQFEMELNDLEGNRKVLDSLNYQIAYQIGQRDIDIQASGSKFQYHIQTTDSTIYENLYNGKNEVIGDKSYEMKDDQSYLLSDNWRDTYQNCDIQDENIASYPLSYRLDVSLIDPNDKQKAIVTTSISDNSNDEYQLKKYMATCKVNDSVTKGYRIEKDKIKDIHRGLYFQDNKEDRGRGVYQRKDTIYFMPPMDQHATGQNEIYEINLKENQENKVTAITKLPKNRLYETMEISDNELYVFSHDDTHLYITVYQTDGTLVKEMKIDYQYHKGDTLTEMYVRNHHVIWKMGTKYRVIDMDHMKTTDAITIEQEMYDLTYVNDTLYLLTKGSEEESWYLQAYQGSACVYKGEIKVPYRMDHTISKIKEHGKFLN